MWMTASSLRPSSHAISSGGRHHIGQPALGEIAPLALTAEDVAHHHVGAAGVVQRSHDVGADRAAPPVTRSINNPLRSRAIYNKRGIRPTRSCQSSVDFGDGGNAKERFIIHFMIDHLDAEPCVPEVFGHSGIDEFHCRFVREFLATVHRLDLATVCQSMDSVQVHCTRCKTVFRRARGASRTAIRGSARAARSCCSSEEDSPRPNIKLAMRKARAVRKQLREAEEAAVFSPRRAVGSSRSHAGRGARARTRTRTRNSFPPGTRSQPVEKRHGRALGNPIGDALGIPVRQTDATARLGFRDFSGNGVP